MEGDDKIGLVLDRASRLRFKITDAIRVSGDKGAEMEYDEEESLFGIQDAVESLEKQLASLQVLHQQQRYQREAALAQINQSRKTLLIKLEEYKGEDFEVIHEAATFASETGEQHDGFFLPPYPIHLPDLFVVNGNHPSSHLDLKNKPSKNGLAVDSTPQSIQDSESQMDRTAPSASQNMQKGMGFVLGLISKSVICFVGLVSALSLAGFKLEIRKRDIPINLLELFPKTAVEEREVSIQCPPGKVLVFEDGKARCLVKERIEIPFDSNFKNSNIYIAFG